MVLGASGTAIRFAGDDGVIEEAAVAELAGSGRLQLQRQAGGRPGPQIGLAGLPPELVERARWWEAHIIEVVDGTRPDVPAGTPPRPEYDAGRTTLREREQAKSAELSTPDRPVSASTVKHRRQRWQAEGLPGLVDQAGDAAPQPGRPGRSRGRRGDGAGDRRGDRRFVADGDVHRLAHPADPGRAGPGGQGAVAGHDVPAVLPAVGGQAHDRVRGHPPGPGGRPQRMFSQAYPAAPGELMEIDSTPLDVMVLLDDGVPGRVELTGMIDVATRTVPAAVLRPTAKSVDASVLLARALTPEPMRPGWPASLAMAHSALPYDRLLGIDERLRHAAARPVIVPDTIVIDHGSVFVSDNFRSSCRHLGISIQPAHLATGSDKPHIEKMFSSLGTLFCQFAAGYLGRSADRRGRHVEGQPLWSLMQMQDLLDEWLISVWQNRAHDGLRDPLHPQRTFSPNQKYAALIETAGYVPVPLSGEDYIELLPAIWRAVNAYGIKISHRTYDAAELNPIRQQKSGVAARKGLWEVRHDPYDVSRVFVRGPGGWITCPWKYLGKVPVPFGELAWDHVSGRLAEQGRATPPNWNAPRPSTTCCAAPTTARRTTPGQEPQAARQGTAAVGPGPAGRRPHARRHGGSQQTPAGAGSCRDGDAPETPQQDSGEPVAKVIPLGIFNAHEEAKKRW